MSRTNITPGDQPASIATTRWLGRVVSDQLDDAVTPGINHSTGGATGADGSVGIATTIPTENFSTTITTTITTTIKSVDNWHTDVTTAVDSTNGATTALDARDANESANDAVAPTRSTAECHDVTMRVPVTTHAATATRVAPEASITTNWLPTTVASPAQHDGW